jgi:hypothetical protein
MSSLEMKIGFEEDSCGRVDGFQVLCTYKTMLERQPNFLTKVGPSIRNKRDPKKMYKTRPSQEDGGYHHEPALSSL